MDGEAFLAYMSSSCYEPIPDASASGSVQQEPRCVLAMQPSEGCELIQNTASLLLCNNVHQYVYSADPFSSVSHMGNPVSKFTDGKITLSPCFESGRPRAVSRSYGHDQPA